MRIAYEIADITKDVVQWQKALDWCEEQFGKEGENWDWVITAKGYDEHGAFRFKNEKDAMWFALNWS